MASFEKYPEYQASKYAWIGALPKNWNVRRLKEVGRLFGGAGFPHEHQNVQGEELYFYKVGDLSLSENGKTLLESPHTISKETARVLRATIVPKGAIVYAKIGAALLLNRRRMTTAECCIDNNMTAYVTEAEKVIPEWAFYWLSTIDFGEHVNPGAVPSFSEGYQSVLPIPVPSVEEQKVIARFLDFKTAQIDALIAKKRALLERLAEKRTALISHAVTKGLDSSVAMKDSGVAWLGKIPAHWAIDRAKWSISSCQNGVWGAEPNGDDDLVCIRVADFDRQPLRVSTAKLTMRSIAEKDRRNRLLSSGNLLLEKSGGGEHQLVGAVVEFNQPFPAVSSNFIARMVVSDDSDPRFLVYVHSHLYAGRVNYRSIKQTTGIQNLDSQSYLDESIGYPPLEEQKVIGKFLDDISARMDVQKNLINAAIDRLMEYRSALVASAVTGKIDVRGFKVPQSVDGIAS